MDKFGGYMLPVHLLIDPTANTELGDRLEPDMWQPTAKIFIRPMTDYHGKLGWLLYMQINGETNI